MELVAVLAIWLLIVVVSMIVVSFLAVRFGRDPFGWALLSAVLGPIAIVALAGTRKSDRAHPAAFETPAAFEGRGGAARPAAGARCIVAAVDGSEAGDRVARYIADSHPQAADVALLVVLPMEMRTRGGDQQIKEHEARIAKMSAGAERILRDAGVSSRVAVGYGKPADEIVRFAEAENASVIVIGRRGAGLSKALLGSVSDAVVKHATMPVALID